MNAADKETILKLIDAGKAVDIVDLIIGDSPYRVTEEVKFANSEERDSCIMTVEHLRFISKYGAQRGPVKENGRVYSPYPDYFEKWFELGTPGLGQADLDKYLSCSGLDLT